jgi:SagB-type dehydrogenase family enzyme
LQRGSLGDLLSLISRPVRTDGMPYKGAAPLLRKTSPSGGSRHPTEFYVIASGIPGLSDGAYQIAPVDGVLDSVDSVSTPPAEWLDLLGLAAPARAWALILYSSLFERNRYRYREPRTFRTVHMDVGHLMTTCEFIGRANGWRVQQVQHLNGSAVAAHLGVDRYVECPISATLLSASLEKRK